MPTRGSEQNGFRPVVIISGNALNDNTPICIICPLTSQLKHYHGNVILAPNNTNCLKRKAEILTFHVRSVSKEQLKQKIGRISTIELQQVKNCLQDILRY